MNKHLHSLYFPGLVGLIFLLLSASASDEEESPPPQTAKPQNVILLIADDYGVVSAEAYADLWESASLAPTPNINSICRQGVRFQEVWSNSTCSPTRATLLTGRFSFRTGVGFAVPLSPVPSSDDIGIDEPTLPRLIDAAIPGYALANIGKWHLGTGDELQGALAPNVMGWRYYAGSLEGSLAAYNEWQRTENGVTNVSTTYATTQTVDDAIAFLDRRHKDQPFVLWMAFDAPHNPLHLPPAELHSYNDLPGTEDDIAQRPLPYFEAMTEALDTEIGRLLAHLPDTDGDGLPDDTMVVFMGDNGTEPNYLPEPYAGLPAKLSLYRHGIQTPLCIAGAGVHQGGRDIPHPVGLIDVHATVLDLLGVDPTVGEETIDAVSLRPYLEEADIKKGLRPWVFSEQFYPDELDISNTQLPPPGATIYNGRHKLIRYAIDDSVSEECYDLQSDPREESNLLSPSDPARKDLRACDRLRQTLLKQVCSEPDGAWSDWCE